MATVTSFLVFIVFIHLSYIDCIRILQPINRFVYFQKVEAVNRGKDKIYFCLKFQKTVRGFLLIELLIAFSIISVLLITITGSLSRSIQHQQNLRLRLKALNSAISQIEQTLNKRQLPSGTCKKKSHTVTVQPVWIDITQEKIDRLIPAYSKKGGKIPFQPILVTSEWKNCFGQKKRFQLISGFFAASDK